MPEERHNKNAVTSAVAIQMSSSLRPQKEYWTTDGRKNSIVARAVAKGVLKVANIQSVSQGNYRPYALSKNNELEILFLKLHPSHHFSARNDSNKQSNTVRNKTNQNKEVITRNQEGDRTYHAPRLTEGLGSCSGVLHKTLEMLGTTRVRHFRQRPVFHNTWNSPLQYALTGISTYFRESANHLVSSLCKK